MATPPSVTTQAVTREDYSSRQLLIGVQPQEFEDFCGGLRPGVNRRIGVANGIVPGLVSPGYHPLQSLAGGQRG